MQTFLPYSDFELTAQCLDNRRLGNQCWRETKTLVTGGWPNHPAAKMWLGHHGCLATYGHALAVELVKRGYTSGRKWATYYAKLVNQIRSKAPEQLEPPSWLGDQYFHRAHQSNLLRKDPIWYSRFEWDVPADLEYIWPTP